jgi:hypothetical protein
MNVVWMLTGTNPHRPRGGYDCGRTTWHHHAVEGVDSMKASELPRRALCGVRARWGWDLDMYAASLHCSKCLRKLGIACKVCNGTGYRGYETCMKCLHTGIEPGADPTLHLKKYP